MTSHQQNEGAGAVPVPYVWDLESLARYARHEDPEVRAWAAARLIQHYPAGSADRLAPLVLDEASGMAERVAEYLAAFGSTRHLPLLERGFRHGSGRVPAACLDAMARLGHESVEEQAASAMIRQDLGEEGAAALLVALLRHGEPEASREVALAHLRTQPAVMADPAVARQLFARLQTSDYPALVDGLLVSLAWQGADRTSAAFRAVLEAVEVDDAGWLVHTDRGNRVEFDRTLKTYDSRYDTETRARLGEEWTTRLRTAFRDGDLPAVADAVRVFCEENVSDAGASGDPLPGRIQALVEALAVPAALASVERLGPSATQPVAIALLSCALKLADFRSFGREIEAAGADLDRLLELAEVESAVMLDLLPGALERAAGDSASRARVARFAAETLGRQGPWYGKLVALDVIGRLGAAAAAPEVIRALADDSDLVAQAAGRALERMGPGVVEPIHDALENGHVDPESLEWMVAAVCQAGTHEALRFMLDHLDELVAELDAGYVCEWTAVLGSEELIPRFRSLLDVDMAMVGRALMLVSAIHNRRVPEEERILHAAEHGYPGEGPDPDEGMEGGPGGGGGGPYVM